jgi:DNA-binding GntR family transcriptional regulator
MTEPEEQPLTVEDLWNMGLRISVTQTTPLHLQLMTRFHDLILDGSIPADTLLPAEADIAARLRVSRGTVNRAMVILGNRYGLVVFVPGRGRGTAPQDVIDRVRKDEAKKRR